MKFTILVLSVCLFLAMIQQTKRDTPILTDGFVISHIKTVDYGCLYASKDNRVDRGQFGWHINPAVILPCGMYQIGDTIKPSNL